MPPLLGQGDTIDLEFAKWLLIGMGTAVVGQGTFIYFLVKKGIENGATMAVALNKSSDAIEENTEALRELEARK